MDEKHSFKIVDQRKDTPTHEDGRDIECNGGGCSVVRSSYCERRQQAAMMIFVLNGLVVLIITLKDESRQKSNE